MIEEKELPSEYVSIRQAWIKAINRVAEAMAYRYKTDVHDQYSERSGEQTVIESVSALNYLLVDFGEAPIKTEVMEWYENERKKYINADQMQTLKFFKKWFEFMIQTLNKYGMLFQEQPKGYSNVIMEEVK